MTTPADPERDAAARIVSYIERNYDGIVESMVDEYFTDKLRQWAVKTGKIDHATWLTDNMLGDSEEQQQKIAVRNAEIADSFLQKAEDRGPGWLGKMEEET